MTIRSIGIEEEFLLYRRDSAELCDVGPRVADAATRSADDDVQFEKELKAAQVELATRPDTDASTLARDLTDRRAEIVAAAEQRNARVVAVGTSPTGDDSSTTENPRYREMTRTFGAVLRRQLTCAMHVHVSIDSDAEGVAVLNGIASWLPVLTALSANSPFHGGTDTGYASFRRIQWGEWPTAGPTGAFGDEQDYHRTVESLIATGAARDDGMIYFDARLSANYPTVEIRVCDVAIDVRTSVALAALARGLVTTVAATPAAPVPRTELLAAAHWRAARFGTTDRLVDLRAEPRLVPAPDLAGELLDLVTPALDEAGDTGLVRELLETIDRNGTDAERQRTAVEAADGDVAAAVDLATLRG